MCKHGLRVLLYILFVLPDPDPLNAQTTVSGTRGVASDRGVLNVSAVVRSRIMAANPADRPQEIHPPQPGPDKRTPLSEPVPQRDVPFRPGAFQAPAGAVPSLVASFPALGDNNAAIPPDTHGAAGPDHLMVTLNTEVRIQDRTSDVISTVGLNTFWTGIGISWPFDPKILYDHMSGLWIFTAMADPSASTSSVLIGVSQTADPTGSWNIYRIEADASNIAWADYPSIGFNKDWIVIQVNMFTISGDAYTGSNIYVFDKADLYAGGPGSFTLFQDFSGGFTQNPAITYDDTLSTMYLLEEWIGNHEGFGSLRLTTISGEVGNEVYTVDVAFPSTSDTWAVGPPGNNSNFAPQSGAITGIMTNDARLQNVVYRNGSLWCTHTIFLPETGVSRSAIQWWELSPSGAVLQRGRVDDAENGKFYAFPSIAVNQNSDVLIGYSRFGADQYASGNYAFRSGDDLPNTLQEDTVLKEGEAKYVKTFGTGRNRWGDYSNTVVDPVDDTSFWTIQQYAEEPVSSSDRWGTWWGQVAPTLADPVISATPSTVDFDLVPTGKSQDKLLIIRNEGTGILNITDISTASGVFSVEDSSLITGWGTITVGISDSVTVTVSFLSNTAGVFTDTLAVSSNDPNTPVLTVPLSGLSVFRGDMDGDSEITILDLVLLARTIIGLNPEPIPDTLEFYTADANDDGDLNVIDVILQVNQILNIPTRPMVSEADGRVYLSLDEPLALPTGQTVIPVVIDAEGPLAGVQLRFAFDENLLRLEVPFPANPQKGMTLQSFQADGILRLIMYSPTGQQINGARKILMYFPVSRRGDSVETPYLTLEEAVLSDRHARPIDSEIIKATVKIMEIPSVFSLKLNTPNPFNPTTRIGYEVPKQSHITLIVFNLLGQEVIRLVDTPLYAGRYTVEWHGANARGQPMPSGVYVYRMTSSTGYSESRRMLLLK